MIASDFVVLDHCASWFNLTAECLAGTNAALLRPEVTDALADSDVILHAGDINKESILDNLRNIAPVYVVLAPDGFHITKVDIPHS